MNQLAIKQFPPDTFSSSSSASSDFVVFKSSREILKPTTLAIAHTPSALVAALSCSFEIKLMDE